MSEPEIDNRKAESLPDCAITSPIRDTALIDAERRILLWDIDGTLIHSLRVGGYKRYMVPVLEEIFGTAGHLPTMRVSGMTDVQIVVEALRDEGVTYLDIQRQMERLTRRLTEEARKVTTGGEPFFELLPGVREILTALHTHPRYQSALVTGNISPMAQLKMELVGLTEFFTLPGAFGEESHERKDLPGLAATRIQQQLQSQLMPQQFIVIGDTPNDIACAQHYGARAVALGTGRFYSQAELMACNPDVWLQDLSNVEVVIETLDQL